MGWLIYQMLLLSSAIVYATHSAESSRPVCAICKLIRLKLLSFFLSEKYSKCPKISNTLFHTFLAQILLFMQLFLKIPSGMANSVDPDQTAPSGAV